MHGLDMKICILFNSNCSVEYEFLAVIDKINQLLQNNRTDETTIIEINNSINDFKKYDDYNSRLIDIKELTLNTKDNCTYKINIREYKNNRSFVLNIYSNDILISSKKLSKDEYIEYLLIYGVLDSISYKRLYFIYELQLFKVNFYKGKTTLEFIENKLNNKLKFPEEIKFFDKEKKYVKL